MEIISQLMKDPRLKIENLSKLTKLSTYFQSNNRSYIISQFNTDKITNNPSYAAADIKTQLSTVLVSNRQARFESEFLPIIPTFAIPDDFTDPATYHIPLSTTCW